jgi:hypothetical protein
MDKAIIYLKSKGVEIFMRPVNFGNSKRAKIKEERMVRNRQGLPTLLLD